MPKRKKRSRHGFSFLTSILFISFIVVVALCGTRIYDLKMQHDRLVKEADSLATEEQLLKDELHEIKKQQTEAGNAEYIESEARTQLDMVYPGEVIFRVNGN